MTRRNAVLFVCNYPPDTGYAWDFIQTLYAGLAQRLQKWDIAAIVAYPRIDSPPLSLRDSVAEPVVLDATLSSPGSVRSTIAFARAHNVRLVYLTDRPAWSLRYASVRSSGIARILVHDHTSGARSIPTGLRRAAKWVIARTPGIVADDVVAVSDFVARRHVVTGQIPASRITRVWNGIPIPDPVAPGDTSLHDAVQIAAGRPVVVCACRAAPEKGVLHLVNAFDRMLTQWPEGRLRPALVYLGDGPQLAALRAHCATLTHHSDILLPGFRPDASALLRGADVCVTPSVWQDALPLAVMQAMARGLPVIASSVGGIPEMIIDGESGLLVPPADDAALAVALRRLLDDRPFATALGRAARLRVAKIFTPEQQLDALSALILKAFPDESRGA